MINRALKLIRQFHKIKQVNLASELGISKSYLSEIESGKKPVSLEILEKYSKLFDVPVSSLVFFSESLNSKNKLPEKFRMMVASKIISVMDWVVQRNAEEKAQI